VYGGGGSFGGCPVSGDTTSEVGEAGSAMLGSDDGGLSKDVIPYFPRL
jgi:hypothetical protein